MHVLTFFFLACVFRLKTTTMKAVLLFFRESINRNAL